MKDKNKIKVESRTDQSSQLDLLVRQKPTSLQAEPNYPNHETVIFCLSAPDWVVHKSNDKCRTEHPHSINKCGMFSA